MCPTYQSPPVRISNKKEEKINVSHIVSGSSDPAQLRGTWENTGQVFVASVMGMDKGVTMAVDRQPVV